MKMIKGILRSVLPIAVSISAGSAFANESADYFARFKYTQEEAIQLLKAADGKAMVDVTEARNLLDDLGYWRTVRQESVLRFTPELQKKIEAQFEYLKKAFTYESGDMVWVYNENDAEKTHGVGKVNHRAQILSHARVDGTDFYTVQVLIDGSSKMANRQGTMYDGRTGTVTYYGPNYELKKEVRVFTKAQLDALNSPGSSLPVDSAGEKLDWSGDKVWRDKLEDFKKKMVGKNFEMDFTKDAATVEKQQQELMVNIFRHFKMNRNAPSKSGQGIGLRSCGGGVCFDQALVLTYAIQAVGQTSGIKAYNLNGTTVNPMGGHGFVRYDLKTRTQTLTFDRVHPYEMWEVEYAKLKAAAKDPANVQTSFDLPAEKAIYPGVSLRTSTWVGISDPGWADYGVTEDFFARVPVGSALNPLPIDSNRGVNGMSSQRNLVEVAEKVQAKGPLNSFVTQTRTTLDATQSRSVLEAVKKGENFKFALEDALGAQKSCERGF